MRRTADNEVLHALMAPPAREPEWSADHERVVVGRAKADREAFAALYDHYLTPVYRYCLLRLDSREAAEDATSQVFTKALASLGSCRDETFGGWLFAIARSVVADHWRKTRPDRPLQDAENVPARGPAPEELAVANDERRRFRATLQQLVPDQREVVELRMAGLTGQEIALAMDRRLGAVKMLQSRAIARLRVLLIDETQSHSPPNDKDKRHARTR